jgi:cytochrome c-type biogenesis protein
MEPEALREAVEQAGLAAAGVAFLAGLFFSFNPVALASIPVSLAYVTRGRDKSQALLFGTMFIAGMILAHVVLGLIAGAGGRWVSEVMGRAWGLFLGPLLIVLGLLWTGWLRIPLPAFGFRASRPTAAWGAFTVGWLENLGALARYRRAFEVGGGVILMAMGLYMLNATFFWIPALAI